MTPESNQTGIHKLPTGSSKTALNWFSKLLWLWNYLNRTFSSRATFKKKKNPLTQSNKTLKIALMLWNRVYIYIHTHPVRWNYAGNMLTAFDMMFTTMRN